MSFSPIFGRPLLHIVMGLSCAAAINALANPASELGRLPFDSLSQARFQFTGPVGERLQANVDQWLLCAPQSNPGMLEMFRVRDRQPTPQLVPWAGEFVGKYLISAVQALRMSENPQLFPPGFKRRGHFHSDPGF